MTHQCIPCVMRSCLLVVGLSLLFHCGKKSEGKGKARITLKGKNTVPTETVANVTFEAPKILEMILVSVYLSGGIDAKGDNTGSTNIIYLNPECGGEIIDCGAKVTKYFNLLGSGEAFEIDVSATLWDIATGSPVAMSICVWKSVKPVKAPRT